jgi:predicted Zn-dependent protease
MSTAYSRDHEYEADKMGIQIAARACFNTKLGVQVIQKMHDFNVAAKPNVQSSRISQVYDTHPPTLDRYDRLVDMAKEETYRKYKECANKRRLTKRLSCRPLGSGRLESANWRHLWRSPPS